jgi:serine phosphatase RsbU (regulator of sigma subunit)
MMLQNFASWLDRVINSGARADDHIQKIRLIRQVNGLNWFFLFVAVSVGVFLFILVPSSMFVVYVQIPASIIYALNIVLNSKGRLKTASVLTIHTFEWQLFLIMIFTNAWSSPAIFSVALYPLLAALLEKSIAYHTVIGLVQVGLIMGLRHFFPGLEALFMQYSSFKPGGIEILQIMELVYLPVMGAVIINIIFRENLRAREKQKEMLNEITIANRQLEVYAGELKDEAQRLRAEIDIARSIQLMALPPNDELMQISDLDIAAIMRPADEVGGDYYDVIQQDGVVIIGIGDVTGHGLASGLIMMMAQTAIRTITEFERNNMGVFFKRLNRVMYSNIKRTKTDRNMTLAILTYWDKHFTISGQHESLLIRKADGSVVVHDTMRLGFYLGMLRDMPDEVKTMDFKLDSGDALLLYTDGVTEAMDESGEQYGLPKLVDAFKMYGALTAEQIVKEIVKDVYNFMGQTKIMDDISLMIIKQK